MTATIHRERSAHAGDGLLSLDEARARMLADLAPLPVEEVALSDALRRVVARPLDSRLTLPPWDNSAMDGFAVRAADVEGASPGAPVVLRVAGEVPAGRSPTNAVGPGTTMRILTGAPLPPGADAVVPVEDTDASAGVADLPETVAIHGSAAPGAHVRHAGGDLRAGARVVEPGDELDPARLAVLAAAGYERAPVHRRPRVGVLATGDELVPIGTPPGPAQIPDSNSVALVALARETGADARSLGIAGDALDDVVRRLRPALEWADVVVASGGVSVGAHDVVKDAFTRLGQLELWRVAVQPGKPLAFGRAAARSGAAVLLFGLPGNPVSSQVTFELFVRPVLRRLAGHGDTIGRSVVRARLATAVTKSPARRAFLRVRLIDDERGLRAELAGGQESHVLSALAAAHGLAIVPEGIDGLPAGVEVDVLVLR